MPKVAFGKLNPAKGWMLDPVAWSSYRGTFPFFNTTSFFLEMLHSNAMLPERTVVAFPKLAGTGSRYYRRSEAFTEKFQSSSGVSYERGGKKYLLNK